MEGLVLGIHFKWGGKTGTCCQRGHILVHLGPEIQKVPMSHPVKKSRHVTGELEGQKSGVMDPIVILSLCVLSQKQVKSFLGWMPSAMFSAFLPFGSCS